jgi:hypothetical protein
MGAVPDARTAEIMTRSSRCALPLSARTLSLAGVWAWVMVVNVTVASAANASALARRERAGVTTDFIG